MRVTCPVGNLLYIHVFIACQTVYVPLNYTCVNMPSSDSSDGFSLLLDLFCNIPISTFLVRVLSDPDLIDHPVICDLSSHFPSVLSAALSNEQIGS